MASPYTYEEMKARQRALGPTGPSGPIADTTAADPVPSDPAQIDTATLNTPASDPSGKTLTKDQIREILRKRPPGTNPEGIIAALREQGVQMEGYPVPVKAHYRVRTPSRAEQANPSLPASVAGVMPGAAPFVQAVQEGASQLPYIGGAIGGMTGGTPGAGTLGAVGSAAQQLLEGQVPDPQRIAKDSAIQAAFQFIPEIIGLGGRAAGGAFMKTAIGKGTQEAAQTAIEQGLKISQKGLNALMEKIGTAGANTRAVTDALGQAGFKIPTAKIATNALNDAIGQASQVEPEMDIARAWKHVQNFMKGRGSVLSPTQLLKIRQDADAVAKPIFDKMARKEPINGRTLMRYKFFKSIGDNARQELDQMGFDVFRMNPKTGAMGSGPMIESDQVTAPLIALKNQMFPTVNNATSLSERIIRNAAPVVAGGVLAGGLTPGGLPERTGAGLTTMGALAAGHAVLTPENLSTAALFLSNPQLAQILAQSGRGLAAVAQP